MLVRNNVANVGYLVQGLPRGGPTFGEFSSCCSLQLLPGIARQKYCNMATWGPLYLVTPAVASRVTNYGGLSFKDFNTDMQEKAKAKLRDIAHLRPDRNATWNLWGSV